MQQPRRESGGLLRNGQNVIFFYFVQYSKQNFGKGVLIVLTGQRRVGKSYVMKELAARKQEETMSNVIYIDKEKTDFDTIATYRDLVAYVDERLDKSKHNYLLIDEVQEITEFERGLRNYYSESYIDIVVTGSNSDILSGDLGTMLSGRYIEVFIQGLSYPEFLEFHSLEDGEAALNKYINYGGLPGLRPFGLDNPETINDYLQGVYNTILVKDIIRRKKIRNVPFLENLIRFIADNIGKPMSATSIQNFIVGGRRANDIEKIVENLVYQQMVRLGYKVKVGQLYSTEIDFVGTKGDEIVYVQTAYLIAEEKTFNREFGNLMPIKDNYPKYVISLTPYMDSSKWGGIIHIPFADFLKKGFAR